MTSPVIEAMARAISAEAIRQNPMLEGDGTGFYDDYDNKGYDAELIASAAIKALEENITDEMAEAGADKIDFHDLVDQSAFHWEAREAFKAMLRAAREE